MPVTPPPYLFAWQMCLRLPERAACHDELHGALAVFVEKTGGPGLNGVPSKGRQLGFPQKNSWKGLVHCFKRWDFRKKFEKSLVDLQKIQQEPVDFL